MISSRSLTRPVSSHTLTTALRRKPGRFTQVVLGVVTAALGIGPISLAAAQTYHHHARARARDYMAQAYPGGFGPAIGTWRYGLSAHQPNDRAYPMTEWSGHATATGGPSGGIN